MTLSFSLNDYSYFTLTYNFNKIFLTLIHTQEIGITHMGIVEGINSLLQLHGLVAKLCRVCVSK